MARGVVVTSRATTLLISVCGQLIKYVDIEYMVHKDSVGLFQMPATGASPIAAVIMVRTFSFAHLFHSPYAVAKLTMEQQ